MDLLAVLLGFVDLGFILVISRGCNEELSDQIVANYRAMEQFAEGARFLEEFGRYDEAYELLAEIKG